MSAQANHGRDKPVSVGARLSDLARKVLPAAVIRWLRGNENSVRYRFYYGPKEWLSLRLHRLRGGRYIDWYACRLDRFIDYGRFDGADPEGMARFEAYMATGHSDLEVMKQFGLAPHHKLHEFGIGYLRTAQRVIDYLDAGNFSGNDASGGRIGFGLDYLRRKTAIDAKRPLLVVNTDNSFGWLDGRKVDYVWSLAVFTHMPPEDIDDTFANMRKILKPGAVVLFTYSEKDAARALERMNVKDWWHNYAFFEGIAARHGYDLADVTDALPESPDYNPATRLAKAVWRGPGAGA